MSTHQPCKVGIKPYKAIYHVIEGAFYLYTISLVLRFVRAPIVYRFSRILQFRFSYVIYAIGIHTEVVVLVTEKITNQYN